MNFSVKIKDLCHKKNISVTKMEQDLGFSNGYIGKLKDRVPTDRAVMIAEYLGLPSNYFMPDKIKKGSAKNPLLDELMVKASNLSEAELTELLSFVGYIQSKH